MALGTAMAQNQSAPSPSHALTQGGRAYLAYVLGPSVNAARAKVVFAVDGLEVKVWGTREDGINTHKVEKGHGVLETGEDAEAKDGADEIDSESNEEGKTTDDEWVETDEEEVSTSDNDDNYSEEGEEPPASRSPSPFRSPSPLAQPTHAETERKLHTAERLLSRVLVDAAGESCDWNEGGGGISCQELGMSPLS